MNSYYNHSDGVPQAQSRGTSQLIHNEYDLVQAGFDKLPAPSVLYGGSSNYAMDTGTQNNIVITVNSAITSYVDGLNLRVEVLFSCNGPVTINVNGIGTVSVTHPDATQLVTNEYIAGQIISLNFNAAQGRFQFQAIYSAAIGGIPVTGGSMSGQLNFAKAPAVASSATPDIWSGAGNEMHITGTTTITGFMAAPQAGATRWLIFDAATPLTNSANFVVQGAQNYTTAAGDLAFVYADTTTKFYVTIFKANGLPTVIPNQQFVLIAPPAIVSSPVANVDFLTSFSSTYDNYLVILDGITFSAAASLSFTLRNAIAGVVDSAANYSFTSTSTALQGDMSSTGQTSITIAGNILASSPLNSQISFINVNAVQQKSIFAQAIFTSSTPSPASSITPAFYANTNVVTGFRLFASGGSNITGGTIRIFGYRNT